MFRTLSKKLSRKGSGSREQLQEPQPHAASASPPKLVPDAAQAARQQEAAQASGSGGRGGGGGGGGGKPGILRSNSGSGLLVRPKASKPSFLGSSTAATSSTGPAAAAAAGDPTAAAGTGVGAGTSPRGADGSSSVMAGLGTGPLFLTVKPDCLVLRAPASPQVVRRCTCVCVCVCVPATIPTQPTARTIRPQTN